MDHRNKVLCVPTLEDFLDNLRKHETENILKYVQYSSTLSFNSNEKFVPKAAGVIHWLGKKPYITVGTRHYVCHRGKDKNPQLKKKNFESGYKQVVLDHVYIKRRKRVSKKLNCPARFHVNKIFMISNSEIADINKNQKWKAASSIKTKIFKGEEVPGQEMYLFSLPSIEDHKFHNVGAAAAAITEPLDSRVRQKIKELVHKGTRNVKVIRALIEEFVTSELHELDKTRRRFYPTNLVIRNIMRYPGIQNKYLEKNVRNTDNKHEDNIPSYLQNKPEWFIKHVIDKMDKAEKEGCPDVRSITEMNVDGNVSSWKYEVPSQSADVSYVVQFDPSGEICSCTCPDFCQHRLICKHMLQVGMKFPEWKIDNILKTFYKDPVNIRDQEIGLSTGTGTRGTATSDPVIEVDAEHQDCSDSYDKLKPRGSKKECLNTEFKEQMRILQQNCSELEEQKLTKVIARLKVLNEDIANAEPKDPNVVNLLVVTKYVSVPNVVIVPAPNFIMVPANSDNVNGTINASFTGPKLDPKKKSKRVRITADKQRENVNTEIKKEYID